MSRTTWIILFGTLGWATTAFAANSGPSIPLNFGAGEPNGQELGIVDGAAGVAGTRNWNNLFGAEGFGDEEVFLDVGGSEVPSNVAINWVSNNTWATDGRGNEDTNDAPEGNDRALMLGYLDTTDQSITEITLEDIPDDLASGYDVFVYVQNGVLNRGGTYTVSDGKQTLTQTNVTFEPFTGVYKPGAEGNYLVFEGLSGNSLTIEAMATPDPEVGTGFRGPINAVEICAAGACVALPNAVAGRGVIGNHPVAGKRENLVFGPAEDQGPGLAQEWFAVGNPGNKPAIDDVFNNNDPVVPAFRAGNGWTWWTGSDAPFGDLLNYPEEVDPPLMDNYSVRLTGEILINESGTFRFADGVDDFSYLAIDSDRSGVAGDNPDEILIEDNSWTNVFRSANNGGQGLGEIELTVADGGEWLAVEINVAEGGGGDSGVYYWDYNPTAPEGNRVGGGEGFPEFPEDPIFEEDAPALLIPNSHLRSATRPLLSGEINATIPDSPGGWEFEINGDSDTNDAFVLDNPDPNVFTTNLNVDGATFIINAEGEISAGDSFQIIVADNILGTPTIIPPDWRFNSATGSIIFGSALPGDFDGNGVLDAADLDAMAVGMMANDASFDLDGDGDADIDDRLKWVNELKGTWIGDSNLDGAFSTADFLQVFQAGKFETGQDATWAEGDWDGDKKFGTADFLLAFQQGGFEKGPRNAVAAVPEPGTGLLLLLALPWIGLLRRK